MSITPFFFPSSLQTNNLQRTISSKIGHHCHNLISLGNSRLRGGMSSIDTGHCLSTLSQLSFRLRLTRRKTIESSFSSAINAVGDAAQHVFHLAHTGVRV